MRFVLIHGAFRRARPVFVVMDDVQAITNVVCSYAEMLDAGDFDGLHRLFARTAVYTPGAVGAARGPATRSAG